MNLLDGFSITQQPKAPSSQDSENQDSSHAFYTHTHHHQRPKAATASGPSPRTEMSEFCGFTQRMGRACSPGRAGSVSKLQGEGQKGQGFGTILLQILACSFAKRTTIPSRIGLKFERRVAHTAWQIVSSQKRISLSSCSVDHQKLHIYHLIA